MEATEIKRIIDQNHDSIAFVIGNGINRYLDKRTHLSWEALLKQIWKKHASHVSKTFSMIPKGITNTEFIDALEIELLKNKAKVQLSLIKNDIADILKHWKRNELISTIVTKMEILQTPILTTNFDRRLECAFDVSERIVPLINSRSTDYYPWNYYYGRKNKKLLPGPNDGFGIWHIHGMIAHPRSIRIGLNDYMGLVQRSRSIIQKNFMTTKNTHYTNGFKPTNTWLDIVFKKSLFIFGLGLETDEVYLRWLLLQRAKYNVIHEGHLNGWYITNPKYEKNHAGKKLFLESTGLQLIEINNDDIIYKDVWSYL